MRSKSAWKRLREEGSPEAAAALERRYSYLGEHVPAALVEFAGRPGDFAAFTRHRALGPPPEPTSPPLATATLTRDTEPKYQRLPRLYAPAQLESDSQFVEAPLTGGLGTTVRSLENLCRDREDVLNLIDAQAKQDSRQGERTDLKKQEEPTGELYLVDNINEVERIERPTGTSTAHALRKLRKEAEADPKVVAGVVSRPPPPPPRMVAACEMLPFWRAALSAVHRLTPPGAARYTDGTIGLAVGDGHLRLFAQDASRAHFVTLEAETEGLAEVRIPRVNVQAGQWGRCGRLLIYTDHARFQPVRGETVWSPCTAARVPMPPDDPGVGGVVLHRLDLLEALRAAVGGNLNRAALPDEVRLVVDTERRLVVEAPGRGTIRVPIAYAQGAFEVRLAPHWLVDSLGCCPCDEVELEIAGRWSPLSVRSGWLTAILATRSEESFL